MQETEEKITKRSDVEAAALRLTGRESIVSQYFMAGFSASPEGQNIVGRTMWWALSQRGDDGEFSVIFCRATPGELLTAIRERACRDKEQLRRAV